MARRSGTNCIVGAGSVVTAAGVPGQLAHHRLRPAWFARWTPPPPVLAQIAEHYVANGHRYARGLKKIG